MNIARILMFAPLVGCLAGDEPIREGHQAPSLAALLTDQGVKEVPAVDRQRYPDNIGYLYQTDIATVLWMQNTYSAVSRVDLESRLSRGITRGLSGEFLTNGMQHVAPITDAEPTLNTLAGRAVQSVRQLAQYSFTARDYAQSLGDALRAYSDDPARSLALAEAAARIESALTGLGSSASGGSLPAPPPPIENGVLRPGRYFEDAVREGDLAYLQSRARTLQQAVDNRDAEAYGAAFSDVFYAQIDPPLREDAAKALAVSHEDGVLKGQPLDAVVAEYVLKPPGPDLALTMDQLRLINQINLLANQVVVSRQPLVAALLLLDLDRRLGETDVELSALAIWAHIHDLDWLLSQYVRIKADGTTIQDALILIDTIL